MKHLIAVFLLKLSKLFDHTFYHYIYDLSHEIEWKAVMASHILDREAESYKRVNHEFMSISRTAKDIQDRMMEDMK